MTRPVPLLLALLLGAAGCGSSTPVGPSDRPWTLVDFERAAATSSCTRLPRFGSAAFAEMTASSILDAIDPPALPVEQRVGSLIAYQEALRPIFKRYAMTCGDARASLALSTALLELYARLLPLVDAFLATFSPDDPTYATRVGGVRQMNEGIVGIATGAAITVRGTDFTGPVHGVGRRLGAALARLQTVMAPGALTPALGNLDVPPDDDDSVYRRELRAEIRAGLHAPAPAAPAP